MKFVDLQRLSLDEMTATSDASFENGAAEPDAAAAAASSPAPTARELGALALAPVSVSSSSSSFRRLSRARKVSEAAIEKLSPAALVHAALPEVVSVGVAVARDPKAVGPVEASWDVESFSQHEFVRLMERPWYVRRASGAASPRRSALSKHRREHPHRIIASSHRRVVVSSHGGRETGARDDDARSFDCARGG